MKSDKEIKIILVGGHLTPALAVLEELTSRGFKNIKWVGTKYVQTGSKNTSAEYNVISKHGIDFIPLKTGKLWRKVTFKTFFTAFKHLVMIPLGLLKGIVIVFRNKPDIVVSFGGHLGLVMVFASKLFKVKTITHEQTTSAGASNIMISKFADRVLLTWKNSLKYFPNEKSKVIGLPIRKSIFEKSEFKFKDNLPIILAMGGNQGSNTINWRLLEIIDKVLIDFNVVHLTGNSTITNDYKKAVAKKKSLSKKYADRYLVYENLFGDEKLYSTFLNLSDLVIARSGGNTVAELLLFGKLSILIPIPWSSNNEQELNAKLMESTGLARILHQTKDLEPDDLYECIEDSLQLLHNNKCFNGDSISTARLNAKKLIDDKGAKRFVDEIVDLVYESA